MRFRVAGFVFRVSGFGYHLGEAEGGSFRGEELLHVVWRMWHMLAVLGRPLELLLCAVCCGSGFSVGFGFCQFLRVQDSEHLLEARLIFSSPPSPGFAFCEDRVLEGPASGEKGSKGVPDWKQCHGSHGFHRFVKVPCGKPRRGGRWWRSRARGGA